jgi:hypothetical protein
VPRWLLALVLATLVPACAVIRPPPCPAGQAAMRSETLYFGTASARGPVTTQAWRDFLRTEVTPRFPDGLTTWPASGQWRSPDGQALAEASYVLTIVHAGTEAEAQRIAQLVAIYKQRFAQQAVLRTGTAVCASL